MKERKRISAKEKNDDFSGTLEEQSTDRRAI